MEELRLVKEFGLYDYFDSFGYCLVEMDVDDYINNCNKVHALADACEGYGVYLQDTYGDVLDLNKLHEYIAKGIYDKNDLTVLVYNPEIC